ncbi:MAG: alpha/beta hydrolase family protein, partial [Flavobacteriaceae bacterium]
ISLGDFWVILNFIVRVLFITIASYFFVRLIGLFFKRSTYYLLALLIVGLIMAKVFRFEFMIGTYLIFIMSITGASGNLLFKSKYSELSTSKKTIALAGLLIGIGGTITFFAGYLPKGFKLSPVVNAAAFSADRIPHIDVPSPAEKGPYKVSYLSYGSGNDKHRKAFKDQVALKTNSKNGTAFLDNWNGFSGWWRTKYWGFDATQLPLNAHVWYPEGEGVFPLTLIVHGDHHMQDFSAYGYDYLGELLASRGIILASVDQNFLNTSWSDYRGKLKNENNARGWLLLERLKTWHQWNGSKDNPFFEKIDTANIALLGHSKGGEAVAHAVLMNGLQKHPDDPLLDLDYGFNIKSIISIAPVDGQYKPAGELTAIENVNYLVIHGSQDGEVTSYQGSRQFERISFSDGSYYFKAGLFVKGANHGQFNTTWGDKDAFTNFKGFLNLNDLLASEEQEQIAKVYIASFLETTLKSETIYLPLFSDYRTGRKWLPKTIYLNQFEDSNTQLLCTFEEDDDLKSSTISEASISAKNLVVWKEEEIKLLHKNKGSKGLFLKWDYTITDGETRSDPVFKVPLDSSLASYSIAIPTNSIQLDSASVLVFSMAEANGILKGTTVLENNKGTDSNGMNAIDFTIVLSDANGELVRLPLSSFSYLQPKIPVSIWKMDYLFGKFKSETVFQLFQFPLSDMPNNNRKFDFSKITAVAFEFDKSKKGEIIIDNIGFMKDLRQYGLP